MQKTQLKTIQIETYDTYLGDLVKEYKFLDEQIKKLQARQKEIKKELHTTLKEKQTDKLIVFAEGKKVTVSLIKTERENIQLSKMDEQTKTMLRQMGYLVKRKLEYVQIR